MAEANPFAAPAAPPAGGNPFDPFGSQPAATPQQGQFSSAPQAADPQARAAQYSASPYAPVQQPPAAQQAAYGQSPYGQQAPAYPPQPGMPGAPPPQQQQQPPPAAAAYGQGGYGASPYPPATENAVVVSQHQSNPYAGLVAAPPAPYGDSPSVTSATPSTGGNPFDPFAAAPPPPPAPAPQPAYPSYPQPSAGMPPTGQPPAEAMQGYAAPSQTAPPADQSNPFGDFLPSAPAPAPEPAPAPAPEPEPPRHEPISRSLREPPVPLHARPETDGPPAGGSPRNKYSNELAREAPPGASPLPKAELVRKKGYVLARISFRTIVIKKWKQAFWVQYGPHTMLWFRSEADFDDWLNNPYHNQSQRNFLIKLAVNFVHDLYKPNVRGYQVTQCRTKAYGSKMVRQFKLERWMDYGPTIAAAFGSYNPKEVDDLREALVECMRNTPLSGGIRATGAVRQPSREHQGKDCAKRKKLVRSFCWFFLLSLSVSHVCVFSTIHQETVIMVIIATIRLQNLVTPTKSRPGRNLSLP